MNLKEAMAKLESMGDEQRRAHTVSPLGQLEAATVRLLNAA